MLLGWRVCAAARPRQGDCKTFGPVSPPATSIRTNIVHQLKGDEADGFLLLLPDAGSVQRWATTDPATDEVSRVWYVAVTRARRLAAIALPQEEIDAPAHLPAGQQVPVHVA
ncbi:hypothetical protein [Streptomyces sp. NPDC127066]|uniref:hypothetical protein n=1 Tax=Streptomyces sp. NPDC127066 TaxID=3347125 RepID=UPI003655369B